MLYELEEQQSSLLIIIRRDAFLTHHHRKHINYRGRDPQIAMAGLSRD